MNPETEIPISKDESKEKKEMPETTLRTIYFQSVSPEQLLKELNSGGNIRDVSFNRARFGLKGVGSKSSGQLMPFGGTVEKVPGKRLKPGWIEDNALRSAKRTHIAPTTGYTPMGRRPIYYTVASEGVSSQKPKRVLFLSARISPFDSIHALHEGDHYEKFPDLSVLELEESFHTGGVFIGGADRPLMESLLDEDLLKKTRPNSPVQPRSLGEQDPVGRIQEGYVQQAKMYEMEKKKEVLLSLIQFGNISLKKREKSQLIKKCDSSQDYGSVQDLWYTFVEKYLNGRDDAGEIVARALKYANFSEELSCIQKNLKEGKGCVSEDVSASLRLFLVVPDPFMIDEAHRELLEKKIFTFEKKENDFLRSFFEKDIIQPDLLGGINEKDVKRFLEERLGIPPERYATFSGDFDGFLNSLVKDVFSDDVVQRVGIERRLLYQFEGVSNCDAERMLEILSGKGTVVKRFRELGKGALDRLMFEVRRKLYCMAIIARAVPSYEKEEAKGNSPFGRVWESIALAIEEPGIRKMDFGGNGVSVKLDTRVKKERLSFIRKVLLRGEIATKDMYALSATLETRDPGLISRVKKSILVDGEEEEIEDLQLVFSFLEKIKEAVRNMEPRGTWKFYLDRFEPTPADGLGYRGAGPGSSVKLRFGKVFIRLVNPLGTEYTQEVQIFTPLHKDGEVISAEHFHCEKKKDDASFRVRRLIEGTSRSFAEAFFPHRLYQATPKAHKQ